MEKIINIAGDKNLRMTLDGPQPKPLRGRLKVLNELIGYLYCFLGGNVYPGNMEQTTKTVGKMLQNAVFIENKTKLLFSFPKKIQVQFLLENRYVISLVDNDVFELYCKKLRPKANLSCSITIDASGKEM